MSERMSVRTVEISTASLSDIDMMCAMYLDNGIANPSFLGTGSKRKVWANRTDATRIRDDKVLNVINWYSPTSKWDDAGGLIENFLTCHGIPRGSWPLSELIRHILMVEYGDSLEIP